MSLASTIPLSGSNSQNSYLPERAPDPGPGRMPSTEVNRVSGDYFSTLDIKLVAGRTFTADDRRNTRKVGVVDTLFAKKNFGTIEAALGQRFSWGGRPQDPNEWVEIVGVVEHVQNYGLGQPTREQAYQPYTQNSMSAPSFIVRTDQDPAALASSVRAAMREVAPDFPIFGVRTMTEYFNQSIGTQRLTVTLLGSFGALALLLASVGLYGVLNYTVGQRTREIGVRMALGALPSTVTKLVLSQGAKLAGIGLAIGLLGALGVGKLLGRVLYEVSPFDPASFALVAMVLAAVGLLACWLPARRAIRVNPTEALRSE